jgi:MFS family permease
VQTLAAGFQFVWRSKLILAAITLDLFAVLLGGATYLLPVFAKDILDTTSLAVLTNAIAGWFGMAGQASTEAVCVGLLRSSEAVGAVAMAVTLAHLPPMKRAGRTLLFAVAGFGAATAVFGFSHSLLLSAAMMFTIGAVDNISVVVRHTLVQMLTPDSMRGRVSAVNGIFIVASNDLGGFESGLTASLFGPVASVVGGGLAAIGVVCAASRLWPQVLTIGSLEDIQPIAEAEAAASVEAAEA